MNHTVTFSGSAPGIFAEETARSKRYNMVARHFHEGLELYFLLEGQRCYFIDQDTYRVQEGMAVLINRNQIHKTSTGGSDHRHRRFLLQIDARKFEGYLKLLGFTDFSALGDRYRGVCTFSAEDWARALELIAAIKQSFAQAPPSVLGRTDSAAYRLVTLRVMELLMLFVQNRTRTEETAWKEDPHAIHTGMYQKVHEIALFLQNHCASSISLEELAARFYISKPYLTRIFKSVTGFTVVEYRTFCRIQKAKALLAETDLSITEIAAQTGFGNITYFERVFREATDGSPLRYRKEYRK